MERASKARVGESPPWVQIPPPPPWGPYETEGPQVTKSPAGSRKRFLAGGFVAFWGGGGRAAAGRPVSVRVPVGAAVPGQELAPVGAKADELCRWRVQLKCGDHPAVA